MSSISEGPGKDNGIHRRGTRETALWGACPVRPKTGFSWLAEAIWVACWFQKCASAPSWRRWPRGGLVPLLPLWAHCLRPSAAMETFCETVQFYLRHLEDSAYPVMTEDQLALKLFPMYRYFVTVWLRDHNPEVRSPFLGGGSRGPPGSWLPSLCG